MKELSDLPITSALSFSGPRVRPSLSSHSTLLLDPVHHQFNETLAFSQGLSTGELISVLSSFSFSRLVSFFFFFFRLQLEMFRFSFPLSSADVSLVYVGVRVCF